MNIVDLITSQLGGDVLSKLGGQMGVSESQTKTAVSAAVPAMLGMLGKLAGTPSGAKQISSAMDGLDLGMLGNLASAFSGSGAEKTSDLGGKLLGTLLGGGGSSALAGALGSFVGLKSGMGKTLLSFLAPVILGTIAKQFKGTPDPAQVGQFFSEQQSNIANAMPKGFSLGDFASEGVKSVQKQAVPQSAGLPSWLPLVAIAALAGAVGYYLLGRPAPAVDRGPLAGADPTLADAGIPAEMAPVVQPLPGDAADLLAGLPVGKDLTSLLGNLTTTLQGVTDVATAQEALPVLEGFGPTLEAVTAATGALPAEQKGTIVNMISEQMGPIMKLVDTVMAIPGVKNILGPVVTPMIEALGKLGA